VRPFVAKRQRPIPAASARQIDAGDEAGTPVDDLDLPRPRLERQALAEGQVALRWCAAGTVEAPKEFCRVNGHLHRPTLQYSLERRRR
jgi:hypothetical protein